MPYINEDGSIDVFSGAITKCDRCYCIEKTNEKVFSIYGFWDRVIFARRQRPQLGVFCFKCANEITPMIYVLRDVDELKLFVNKLERAINEKRKQRAENNRTAKDDAR